MDKAVYPHDQTRKFGFRAHIELVDLMVENFVSFAWVLTIWWYHFYGVARELEDNRVEYAAAMARCGELEGCQEAFVAEVSRLKE